MDSIRENRTKDDIIAEITLERSNDLTGELSFVLVEGTDDICLVRDWFCENVICAESFSGKQGLHELLQEEQLQFDNIIAIRDKDYVDIATLPNRMFVYDYCCMEMMLLANPVISKKFYDYYTMEHSSRDTYIVDAMRKLAPYSILRQKNELQEMGISFVGFGGLVAREGAIDMVKLFQRVGIEEECCDVCQQSAGSLGEEELREITNGHDMCSYLGMFSKITGNHLGEKGVRKVLLGMFRKEDFQQTDLYESLCRYQNAKGVRFL